MNNVTFIIPVKIDSDERLNNLDFAIAFLQKNFGARVIIVEEDEASKVTNRYSGVEHIFIQSYFPIFQRTRLVNKAVNEFVITEYICLLDMDIFLDADIYVRAVKYLKTYSVVYPFNGCFYDIPNSYTKNKNLRMSDVLDGHKSLLNGNAIGAIVFFRTSDFILGGMDNENFLGWGYEDNERYVRFSKLVLIKKMDNPVFHFWHPRNINSSGTNPDISDNYVEFDKINRMSRTEITKYIDRKFYWCRKRKIMKISIVIPTYEANGRGVEFVQYNIGKILEQTFQYFNIIVTDHSVNDDIKNLVASYRDDRIVYLKNTTEIGSSTSNLNFGIAHAGGNIVKPILHDDYLCNVNALKLIHDAFIGGAMWVMTGSNDTFDRMDFKKTLVPAWNDDMVYGRNTLGSPSALAYRSDCGVLWDERLLWLMDVKFYKELFDKYGLPYVIKDLCVTNYGHEEQLTNTLSEERKKQEVELMKQEYSK